MTIFESLVGLDPEKIQSQAGFKPGIIHSRGGRLTTRPTRRSTFRGWPLSAPSLCVHWLLTPYKSRPLFHKEDWCHFFPLKKKQKNYGQTRSTLSSFAQDKNRLYPALSPNGLSDHTNLATKKMCYIWIVYGYENTHTWLTYHISKEQDISYLGYTELGKKQQEMNNWISQDIPFWFEPLNIALLSIRCKIKWEARWFGLGSCQVKTVPAA